MKVYTITCHNALNHGARLQACALLYFLDKQGHEAEVIDYRPDYMSFAEKLFYWPGPSLKEWVKLFVFFGRRRDAIQRNKAFDCFSDRYISRTRRVYHNLAELQSCPPRADIYIAGSDQIWNTSFHNGLDAAFYLDFGSFDTKRISYAASFAMPSLVNGSESFIKEHIAAFDSLSVREQSGLHILSSLGYKGAVVADPVFLLSAAEWDALMECADSTQPYILVYDVMGCNTVRRIAKQIAKQRDCKIYSIGSRRLGYADRNFTQAAPNKFVELVRNARCVVSNSYHGTAFAMIFHKDFFVVDRDDGQNERMHDLLDRCGLQSHRIDSDFSREQITAHITYDAVDEILRSHIVKSKAFLNDLLTVR